MDKIQGIYQILNKVNNKVYVGQAYSIQKRWKAHLASLTKNRHYNKHLQFAWNKYGLQNFDFQLLEQVDDDLKLDEREQYWLDALWSNCYNIQPTAGGSPKGQKRNLTDIAKENISNANKSRPWTEDERKKQSESLKGIKRSDSFKERRKQIMLGSKHSDETKEKISKALKGRVITEKAKKEIGQAQKGRIKSPEEIKKRNDKVRMKPPKENCFKGVRKRNNKWYVRIWVNGKDISLGGFLTAEEAALQYDKIAKEHFGNNCYLNFE